MGQKDKTEKILASYNDVFADIVNGCLFGGEQVAQAREFTDATPWSYYKAVGQIRDQERDIAKYWHKGNICISLIGIENQTKPDPYMPIRVMSYDAAEYRNQLGKKGIKTLHPVISIVLYLNHESRWTEPLTLRECLDITPGLDRYIHDHRYEDAYNQIVSEGTAGQKGLTMCSVYDQIESQGIEKGRREGYRSAQIDSARSMHEEGFRDEAIARILHIDMNTVQEMLQQT